MHNKKILILGASGMLGASLFRYFSKLGDYKVYGTVRDDYKRRYFPDKLKENLISNISFDDMKAFRNLIAKLRPDFVINCVGIIKQNSLVSDKLISINLNARLPHLLLYECRKNDAKLIHFSTDCVFSGARGGYSEFDKPDASDVYGMTKYLGEINEENCVTIRTSIIGHEYGSNRSLVDWFLSQTGDVKGYDQAIFTGLPTIELAKIIHRYILENQNIEGLYHVASQKINKYDLLNLISDIYSKKDIRIMRDSAVKIDRSLICSQFNRVSGYIAPDWKSLVELMFSEFNEIKNMEQKSVPENE